MGFTDWPAEVRLPDRKVYDVCKIETPCTEAKFEARDAHEEVLKLYASIFVCVALHNRVEVPVAQTKAYKTH